MAPFAYERTHLKYKIETNSLAVQTDLFMVIYFIVVSKRHVAFTALCQSVPMRSWIFLIFTHSNTACLFLCRTGHLVKLFESDAIP